MLAKLLITQVIQHTELHPCIFCQAIYVTAFIGEGITVRKRQPNAVIDSPAARRCRTARISCSIICSLHLGKIVRVTTAVVMFDTAPQVAAFFCNLGFQDFDTGHGIFIGVCLPVWILVCNTIILRRFRLNLKHTVMTCHMDFVDITAAAFYSSYGQRHIGIKMLVICCLNHGIHIGISSPHRSVCRCAGMECGSSLPCFCRFFLASCFSSGSHHSIIRLLYFFRRTAADDTHKPVIVVFPAHLVYRVVIQILGNNILLLLNTCRFLLPLLYTGNDFIR